MISLTVASFAPSPIEWAVFAVGLLLAAGVAFICGRRQSPPAEPVRSATPPPPAPAAPEADAEVITFLGLLQEKGRLIDFLMDDVTPYSDAQVGAAARVVHQGCQGALREHLRIEPIATEAEGTAIELTAEYRSEEFRLLGNVSGEPPFKGTLVHKGWKVSEVNLPTAVPSEDGALPVLAAAQVELS
jgi:hypothetical protein